MADLQIYTFYLHGNYATGMIVVVSDSLEVAQKIAFDEIAHDSHTWNVAQPDQLNNYDVSTIKNGWVISHTYIE
jgi:hypothetical protein